MKFNEFISQYTPLSMSDFFTKNQHHVDSVSKFLECEVDDANKGLKKNITPRIETMLSTFYLVSMDKDDLFRNSIKVVFVFQDTYPTPGAACGIATCTINGTAQPTLSNMFKRLYETYTPIQKEKLDGDIRGWCTQGVLMLNAAFSTRETEIGAHLQEWATFSSQLIRWLSEQYPYLVFVLFGKEAQRMSKHIDKSKHDIIETSHPSGRGYNFGFGTSDIYNQVNAHLNTNLRQPIEWEKYSYIDN